MAEGGVYGERLRDTFGVNAAPAFVARTLKRTQIAATEIRCDMMDTGLSKPIPVEDAFLIVVQLRDVPIHGMWLDGKQIKTAFLPARTANIYDLRSTPIANSISPFHHVTFYLPRAALNAIVEAEDISSVDAFDNNPGCGVIDDVLYNVAVALLPSFRDPSKANKLFVDHMTIAAAAHAVRRYGNHVHKVLFDEASLLSREQRARVEEILASKIDGDIGLADLAEKGGMSCLQLIRSYELTTGKSIHEWSSMLRVERAKNLLLRNDGSGLAEIARLAGYSSLDRFVAEFTHHVGTGPQHWRRTS